MCGFVNPFTVSWSSLHSTVLISYVAITNNYNMGHFKQQSLLFQCPGGPESTAELPMLSCFPQRLQEKNQSCLFQLRVVVGSPQQAPACRASLISASVFSGLFFLTLYLNLSIPSLIKAPVSVVRVYSYPANFYIM